MSVVCVVTIPFVSNYTHGVKGVDYIDGLLALLFMISSLFSTSRIPAMMMINATGSFAETQKGAIGEAILSITISIPAFFIFGIRGVEIVILSIASPIDTKYYYFNTRFFYFWNPRGCIWNMCCNFLSHVGHRKICIS